MRNFFPTRSSGAAVSRPGSLYLTTTRDNNSGARLLPFVYSDSSSFVIEMGIFSLGGVRHIYFRFIWQGAQLQARYLPLTAQTGAFTVGQVVTGATSAATGMILGIITGPLGNNILQIREMVGAFIGGEALSDLLGGAALANGGVYTDVFEVQTGTVSNTFDLMKVKYAQTGAVLTLAHPDWSTPQELRRFDNVNGWPKWTFGNILFQPPYPFFDSSSAVPGGYPVAIEPFPAIDVDHPAREWTWIVTQTVQEIATGRLIETFGWVVNEQWDGTAAAPTALDVPALVAVYPDRAVVISRGTHLEVAGSAIGLTAPAANRNYQNLAFRVITCNVYRGRGGLYGFLGSFDGDTFTDAGAVPDYTRQPPLGQNPFRITTPAGVVTTDGPAAVAFYQDKRMFAGTLKRPTGVFASGTGEYTDFDLHTIVHVPGESLYFELAARKYEEIVHLVSHQQLIIGTKSSVWRLSGAQGGVLDFDSVDAKVIDEVGMTGLAPVLFDGLVIYARTKGTGVRALHFDANILTYTGRDLSEHADHLFIGRSIGAAGANTTKELIDWTFAEDPWGVVWAVRADGMLLSLTIGADEYGWARHDALPSSLSATAGYGTPAAYKRVCSVPEDDEDAVYTIVQRAIAGSFGTNCIERMTSRVRRGLPTDDGCVDCGVMLTWHAADGVILGGLAHLEGETVYVCGKGNAPQGPFTVVGGQIELGVLPLENTGAGSAILYVGMLFYPDLALLPIVSAETKMKKKIVTRVCFEVEQTTGIQAGQDFEHLQETLPNDVADGYVPPVPDTKAIIVRPTNNWDTEAIAVLRQALPLPVTVVGATRELEMGG